MNKELILQLESIARKLLDLSVLEIHELEKEIWKSDIKAPSADTVKETMAAMSNSSIDIEYLEEEYGQEWPQQLNLFK